MIYMVSKCALVPLVRCRWYEVRLARVLFDRVVRSGLEFVFYTAGLTLFCCWVVQRWCSGLLGQVDGALLFVFQ